ncbi:MAG: nicotinate-nucleotide adenylyltransferase [Nitrospirae bacterium]|nr:nicotinate-nucleotide adenylyltransferase [Nitrospirota bacterium]
MRIGILGGTFNPIHNGHLKIAEEVLKRLGLDKILFMPAYIPPHKDKKGIIDAHHRIEMVRLAIADNPGFELSFIEIERGGVSYTIDTLRELGHIYGKEAELFFITGIDAFLEIEAWKDAEALLASCNFIVIMRTSFQCRYLKKIALLKLPDDKLTAMDKGEIESLRLPLKGGNYLYLLNITPVDISSISSRDIRSRILSHKIFKYLLPESVELYIIKNRLYGR